MRNFNKRCPLQPECERKCAYHGHEQDCDYYFGNARPGYEIPEIAKAYEDRAKEMMELLLEDEDPVRGLVMIPLEELYPHPQNPREDLGDLEELASSIKIRGILQNLTVVPGHWMTKEEWANLSAQYNANPTEELRILLNSKRLDSGYTIIIGHRRHAAAKLAGVIELPCVITEMTEAEQIDTMAIENLQRSDLTPYAQGKHFQLMMDLGRTPEVISQKTGFSVSTIRNRVKLTQLDKKKVAKATERGVTMTDLLKLNSIEDLERRNKVLEFAGTADFNAKLKSALEDQDFQKYMRRIQKELEEADWVTLRHDENCGTNGDYRYHAGFDKWSRREVVRPSDAGAVKYVYVIHGPSNITVYREVTATTVAEVLTPEQIRKRSFASAMTDVRNQVAALANQHMELRAEHIKNFSAFASNELEINRAVATAMILRGNSPPVQRMGEILGIKVHNANNCNASLDDAELKKLIVRQPVWVALCAAYLRMEGSAGNYYTMPYNNEYGSSIPVHQKNRAMDELYDMLINLDYEMSEEEIQMRDGTHPLFTEAATLLARYERGENVDGTKPEEAEGA